MTVRPIDGNEFMKKLTLDTSKGFYGEFMDGSDTAYTSGEIGRFVEQMPTLAPPNEWVEALEAINNAAVAYIEGGPYENDLPGMELAVEIDRLSRDFVRPPEGEENRNV